MPWDLDLDWPLIYFTSEWLVRLAMLFYVPQRRTPSAARTWLLFIFVVPWVGLLLYGVFGRAYLPKRRLLMQRAVSERIRQQGSDYFRPHAASPVLGDQFAPAVKLAECLGDFPIVGGNAMELLPDYGPAIDRLIDDIHAAREHVHLLYYIFADDATGRRVADALLVAARRGIACRFLIDFLGSKSARKRLVQELRAGGVEVVLLLPVHWLRRHSNRLDLRNHRKLAIIDGRIAYVGSQNIVNADFKPGLQFEELVARVHGPIVLQLQAVFLSDLYLETSHATTGPSFFPPPGVEGDSPAQALPSGPGFPQANNQRLFTALIHAARHRIVLTTPYFVPDETLLAAIQSAALRGVETHLIVSRQLDQWLVGLAQRSYYESLLECGVQIHLYRERFLHAKHMSVDDRVAVIGSSNMDLRSFLLNAEISLLVYDPQVAAALRAIEARRMQQAETLSLSAWRQRPASHKFFENLSRLVDSLL